MAGLLAQLFAGCRVPQSDRPISAAGGQDFAVRGKCQRANPERVPATQFLALGYVPDADGAVLSGGCQVLAIGRKRELIEHIAPRIRFLPITGALGLELADFLERGTVPKVNFGIGKPSG